MVSLTAPHDDLPTGASGAVDAAPAKGRSGLYSVIIVFALVTTAVAAVAFGDFDVQRSIAAIGRLSWEAAAVALLALALVLPFSSVRFFLLARSGPADQFSRQDHADNLKSILGGMFMFNLLGQSLVRSRQERLRAWGADVVSVTLLERICGLLPLVGLCLIGLALISVEFRVADWPLLDIGVGVVLLAFSFVASIVALAYAAPSAFQSVRAVYRVSGLNTLLSRFTGAIICTMIMHALTFFAFLALATNLDMSRLQSDIIGGILIVMFMAAIPINVGGFGMRELSAAAVWLHIGLPAEYGVALALAMGGLSWLGLALNLPILALPRAPMAPTAGAAPAFRFNRGRRRLLLACAIAVGALLVYSPRIQTGDTEILISFADPVAFIGIIAALVFLTANVGVRQIFEFRRPLLWIFSLYLAFSVSLLVGMINFGLTEWAFFKRFLGLNWVLGYMAIGACAAYFGGRRVIIAIVYVFTFSIIASALAEQIYWTIWVVFDLRGTGILQSLERFFGDTSGFTAFIFNRNQLSFICLCAMVTLFAVRKKDTPELFLFILLGLLSVVIFYTASRNGIAAMAMLWLFCSAIHKINWRGVFIGVSGGIILFFLSEIPGTAMMIINALSGGELTVIPGASFFNRDLGDVQLDRWHGYEYSLGAWLNNILFGAGLGAYALDSISEFGTIVTIHNSFLWIIAEFGLFGFVLIFSPPLLFALGVIKKRKHEIDVGEYGIFTLLLVFGMMSLFHDMSFQRQLWFFIGLFAARSPFLRRSTLTLEPPAMAAPSAPQVAHILPDPGARNAAHPLVGGVSPAHGAEPTQTVIGVFDDGGSRAHDEGSDAPPPTAHRNGGRAPFLRLVRLPFAIRRLNPDVVMTWRRRANVAGLISTAIAGLDVRRVVWTVERPDASHKDATRADRWMARLLARLSRLPGAVAVKSHHDRAALAASGYRPDEWAYLPDGVDTDRWRPDDGARRRVRASLGLDDSSIVIGMIAPIAPQNDHETFFAAAADMASRSPEAHILLIGLGADRLDIPPILNGRAHVLGDAADYVDSMRALDIHVTNAAYSVGFPGVIVEALSTGARCIATDIDESAEILDGVGLVIPPKDVAALSKAMETLAREDKASREKRERDGRQRMITMYGLKAARSRYDALFNRIKNRKK